MKQIGFKIGDKIESGSLGKSIPDVDFQHVLIEGATGSGKTASMILPTLEDRLKRGHTILFFDHKGHEHKKVKYLAKRAGRLGDVVEIGKPYAAHINIMAELDTIRLKDLINNTGKHNDPYWSNSSANLFEDIIVPLRELYGIVNALTPYGIFDTRSGNILFDLERFGIDIYKKPSFQTVAQILVSPEKFLEFREIVSSLPPKLEMLLSIDYNSPKPKIKERQNILAKILSLQKSINAASRFTIETKSNTNSGNNAVLQCLDNTIASYVKKDYININECTIAELMQSNAIVIIDTQSFGDDIMKLLLESILKKAVMRLRVGTHKPMSVFIDEANRVLSSSIDLHNDVLREASVELILAIQNEEQMINKFTQTVWDSIRENIKHRYFIDLEHTITYRQSSDLIQAEPMRIGAEEMIDADYDYFAMQKNQINLKKRFWSESNILPKAFSVIYDLDAFEHESTIELAERSGVRHILVYHNEEIIKKIKKTFPEIIYDYEEDEPESKKFEFEMYPSKEHYHFDGLFDAPYFDEEEERSMDNDDEDDSWISYEDEDEIEF